MARIGVTARCLKSAHSVKLRQRSLVIAGSALTHGLLLAALLLAAPTTQLTIADPGAMGVSLIDGRAFAADAPAAQPAATPKHRLNLRPPPIPSDVTPQYVDASTTEVEFAERDPLSDPVSVAVAAAGAKGQACDLTTWLQQALQADPQVRAALASMPRRALSLSNAMMLWDSDWVPGDPQAAAGLAAVRAAVLAGVRAAPTGCLAAPVRGPELMTLTDDAGTTVIAIGSGEWRWQDLLTSAPQPLLTKAALQVR